MPIHSLIGANYHKLNLKLSEVESIYFKDKKIEFILSYKFSRFYLFTILNSNFYCFTLTESELNQNKKPHIIKNKIYDLPTDCISNNFTSESETLIYIGKSLKDVIYNSKFFRLKLLLKGEYNK